eukprot:TRINITY_DN17711_c0_g3_i1.p2 TRINITY_DN17711_c0_g3~~TRINITY_DN17711_c0_g3_i1.p2  ORF type:complete len:768 (-),score=165.90 TRINITY_DN17711_c0_g3_i1:119-2422(-)
MDSDAQDSPLGTSNIALLDMNLDRQVQSKEARAQWASMSWEQKLRTVLQEDGAAEAIERAHMRESLLKKHADDRAKGGVHILTDMQNEDAIQRRIKTVDHMRAMFVKDVGSAGGYGSCSPVLLLKVFFSALQVLSLARRYDFEWPGYLRDLFEAQSTASGGNTFTIDCFFPGYIGKVYERAGILVVAPIVMGLFAFAYFMLRYLYLRSRMRPMVTGVLFGTNADMEQTEFVVMTAAEKSFYRGILLPGTDDIYLSILSKWPTKLQLWRPVKDPVSGEFLYYQHKYTHETTSWKTQQEMMEAINEQEAAQSAGGRAETIPGWALKDFLCKQVTKTNHFGVTSSVWMLDFSQGRYDSAGSIYDLSSNDEDETARLRLAQVSICTGFSQHACVRLKDQAKDKFLQTCHVWAFLIWPVLTQEVLSLFSCYTIGDNSYIFGETQIQCYTGDYWYYAFGIGLPGVCMSFGFLFLTYRVLKDNTSKIHNCDFRTTRKYSFLFADYSVRYHYWEVCIMLRKLGAVLSAVCLVSGGVVTQALACLLVISIAGVAHIHARPYEHWLPDALESFSLVTCFVTLYFGLYLHTVTSGSFGVFCSLVILITQLLFFSFFLFAMCRSLQAFAEQKQIKAFIPKNNQMSTWAFGWLYFRTHLCCENLDRKLFQLVPPADQLVQHLTKHLYGWPIEKRRDMYNLIRDKYAVTWKAFVVTQRTRKSGLLLCELFESMDEQRNKNHSRHHLKAFMNNFVAYKQEKKDLQEKLLGVRMARRSSLPAM